MTIYQQNLLYQHLIFILIGLTILVGCDSSSENETTVTAINGQSALSNNENVTITPTHAVTATASTRDDAQILSTDINLDTMRTVWLELRGNVLYAHSEQTGFTIITALPDQLTVVTQGPPVFPLMGYNFQVQTKYIFLGTTFCDVTCTGSVTLFNATTGHETLFYDLWPFYPVVRFIQTQDYLIYAFTEDSPLVKDAMLVIDLTKPAGDLVINWLTLIIP